MSSSASSIHTPRLSLSSRRARPMTAARDLLAQRKTSLPRPFSTGQSRMQQDQAAEEEEKKEMDDGEKNIHDILTREFQPAHLEVRDVSGECQARTGISAVIETLLTPHLHSHRWLRLILCNRHRFGTLQRQADSESPSISQRSIERGHCRHSRFTGETGKGRVGEGRCDDGIDRM